MRREKRGGINTKDAQRESKHIHIYRHMHKAKDRASGVAGERISSEDEEALLPRWRVHGG